MKKIISFLILTFLLSSIGYYLIIHSQALGISPFICMFYLMWCPGISAIITCLIYEKNVLSIGWGTGHFRWLAIAYLLPIAYAALCYGIIWLSGLAGIDLNYKFHVLRIIVFGTLLNVAFAAGEEIGWRGFLVPQLYKITSFTTTCFIAGIIWAVWHFPLIISGIYLAKMPTLIQLLLLVITVTAMTFPISWLRLRSGSVWAAVLLHASHNLYIQWLFDPLTKETRPISKYMIGESGIVMAVILVMLAILFWRLRIRLAK